MPHTHHGYNHNENDSSKGYANLTEKEKKMVERVKLAWEENKDVAWTRWEKRN